MQIAVRGTSGIYVIDEDGDFVCAHAEVTTYKPCCAPGTRDCACFGMESVSCDNPDCAGITDRDLERILL